MYKNFYASKWKTKERYENNHPFSAGAVGKCLVKGLERTSYNTFSKDYP
jgi:hypothetical protein